RQHARERLAVAVDQLRKTHGHGALLRGHDFRLRDAPVSLEVRNVERTTQKIAPVRYTLSPKGLDRAVDYIPLRVHSHYSFLDSTLSPSAIVKLAEQHGMSAVAMTDTGNLHGAVEFTMLAQKAGIKPILGTELSVNGRALLLYVESAAGYHNLC